MEQRGDKAGPLPPWADSLCLPPARGSSLGGAAALASLLLPPACSGARWGWSEAGRSASGSGPLPALLEGRGGPSRPADGGPGGGLPGQTG